MNRPILIFFVLIISLYSCRKPKTTIDQQFTVKGTLLNGTTHERFAHQTIDFSMTYIDRVDLINGYRHLGQVNTDDTGGFTFIYQGQNISRLPDARLSIVSGDIEFDSLPINRDINRLFYASSLGSLKVYLQPDTALKQGDTLFLGYQTLNPDKSILFHTDTITSNISGYFKTIRTTVSYVQFYWGVGNRQYRPDTRYNDFIYVAHTKPKTYITGDPVVNEITIHY